MVQTTQRLGRSPSLPIAFIAAGVLSAVFWLTVIAQALGWLDGEVLLATNLLVSIGLAIVVGYAVVRTTGTDYGMVSLQQLAKISVLKALAVFGLFLCIGIVIHTIIFGYVLDSAQYAVFYPAAVARWLVFLAASWVAILLASVAVGQLLMWIRRSIDR